MTAAVPREFHPNAMTFFQAVIAVISVLAAYKAVDVLILGTPVNPRQALTSWSTELGAELPKAVNDRTSLVDVRAEWVDGGLFGVHSKAWHETYLAKVPATEEHLRQEKAQTVASVCSSVLHREVMRLDVPIRVQVGVPNSFYMVHFEVSETLCGARRL